MGRLVIGCLLIAGPLVALKLVIRPALGLARGIPPTAAIHTHPAEMIVTVAGSVAAMLFGYWLYVRWLERRAVSELAIQWKSAVFGLASGFGLIALPMLALYATGHYEIERIPGLQVEAIAIVLVVASTVLLEELVFRGLLLGVLDRAYGPWVALGGQAAVFAVGHVFNDNWSGAIPLVSTFLIGLLWGGFYLLVRNVWAITLHHAAWNLTIFAAGLPLTGVTQWRPFAPLQSTLNGPELLTGGLSGPEVSVLTLVAITVALGVLLSWGRQRTLLKHT